MLYIECNTDDEIKQGQHWFESREDRAVKIDGFETTRYMVARCESAEWIRNEPISVPMGGPPIYSGPKFRLRLGVAVIQ